MLTSDWVLSPCGHRLVVAANTPCCVHRVRLVSTTGGFVTEWLLAFDSGCGSCSDVIDRIDALVSDRLTVVGLGDERVLALRQRALGDQPPFAPTLLRVDGGRVRAWTGPGLSARLGLLLGPARSLRVVRALNRADVVVHGSRRRFLKAVPGVAFGAFLVSGGLAAPAMASPGRRMTSAEAREWAAGLSRLPTGYRQVAGLPMTQRRAVYALLSPSTRADLWREHLRQYRLAHPGLGEEQRALLDRAAAAVPTLFGEAAGSGAQDRARLDRLADEAVTVLGREQAAAAFGVLGPAETPDAVVSPHFSCDCNPAFSPCSTCGNSVPCTPTDSGCGYLWQNGCIAVCGG